MFSALDFHPESYSLDGEGVKDFLWPLSHIEVDAVRDAFLMEMGNYLRAADIDNDKDAELLWLLVQPLVQDIMRLFIGCTLSNRLRESEVQPTWGSNSDLFQPIANGQFPLPHLALRRLPKGVRRHPRWRKLLRGIASPLIRDGFSRKPLWTIDLIHDALTFSNSALMSAHAQGLNQKIVLSTYDSWFGDGSPLQLDKGCVLRKDTLDTFVEIVQRAFLSVDENLPEFLEPYLRSTLDTATRCVDAHYKSVQSHTNRLPENFWSGSSGIIYNRIFGRAVQRNGGKVICFDHGTSSGWWIENTRTVFELNYVDTFVTFSGAMAAGLKNSVSLGGASISDKETKIVPVSAPIPDFSKKYVYSECKPKTALYVSTVYPGESTWAMMILSDMTLTNLQAQMFGKMSSAGWDISMKTHPDSLLAPPSCFDSLFGVKLVAGSLFEAISSYSVLVFDYPQTTAIRDALQTNKPIVLIDYGQVDMALEARKLLEKRIRIIRCNRDSTNKVIVDWDDFMAALDDACELNDNSFFDVYFKK